MGWVTKEIVGNFTSVVEPEMREDVSKNLASRYMG